MEKPQYRSPRLVRSKSGSTAKKEEIISAKKVKKKQQEAASGDGGLVRFLPRSMSKTEVPRRPRSGSTSPSAWALSPGRSSPASYEHVVKKQETRGVSGVLKYFRQTKKVSPLMEEEYHQFRLMYNRLLQWRFANARGQASMAGVKRVAEEKIVGRWVRISMMRKLMMEKRIEIEKHKEEMKMYTILKSEMGLLNEWRRSIEGKNVEAVGRVVRKLSAISICLPLVENAKADVMSVHDVISTAIGVMDNIKSMILDAHSQVEKICILLRELSVILKEHKQFFQQLDNRVTLVASLQAEETSLRVHRIQLQCQWDRIII